MLAPAVSQPAPSGTSPGAVPPDLLVAPLTPSLSADAAISLDELIDLAGGPDDLMMSDLMSLPCDDGELAPLSEPNCWGAALKGLPGSEVECTPGFRRGRRHMKNKFCDACRKGVVRVPLARVRGLPASLLSSFPNSEQGGAWSTVTIGGRPVEYAEMAAHFSARYFLHDGGHFSQVGQSTRRARRAMQLSLRDELEND